MKKLVFYIVLVAALALPASAFAQVLAKKNGTIGLQSALRSALQEQVGASELKQQNVRSGGATYKVYEGLKNGSVVGKVVVVNEQGKEGPIQAVVALKTNCEIYDLGFTRFGEDHGKAAMGWNYLRQYIGKRGSAASWEIDGISGATWTSTSVRNAVSKAVSACSAS